MKRMRMVGLCAIAAIGVVAVAGATGASAATKLTAGKVGAKLSETTLKNHVFTVTGSKVECSEVSFEGSTEALESGEQVLTPVYKGCTAFGFAGATVTNDCKLRITWTGTIHVEPSTCKMTILVNVPFIAKCDVDIFFGGQTWINAFTVFNSGPLGIVIRLIAGGLRVKVTESTGACPLTLGEHENGSLTGESELKAEGTSIQVD